MARRSPDDMRVVLVMRRREKTNDVGLDVNGAPPHDKLSPLELPVINDGQQRQRRR